MEHRISRLVPDDTTSRIAAMAMLVYSLPPVPTHVDALVVFHGLGEHWRIQHALHWWHHPAFTGRFLLIAGCNAQETTAEAMTIDRLRQAPFHVQRLEGVRTKPHALHTQDQAEWIGDCVAACGVTSLALFASPYHILRAYLTLLKTLLKRQHRLPLLPMPTPMPPAQLVPEYGVPGWAMIPGEIHRIHAYQAEGNVATLEELRDYLHWVWQQPLLQSVIMPSK